MNNIYIYLITTVLFFAFDMVWLGLIAKNIYKEKIGFIISGSVDWTAAIGFYLLYIAGILYFAILPALRGADIKIALLNGAILGFLCYATYDLTNKATIEKWPWSIVFIDLIWGTVLTSTVATLSYIITSKLKLG